MQSIVIIGAGHAGGTAAALLRQYGFDGHIKMIGEESYAPYQRPPLSKAWLYEDLDTDAVLLKDPNFYGDHDIDLRLSTTAKSIDRVAKRVTLQNLDEIAYDILILATGTRARRLSIPNTKPVTYLTLRDLNDAQALKAVLKPGLRLSLIGAGYVGLEVCATALKLGCQVHIFERENRVLARISSKHLARYLSDYHSERGAHIHTDSDIIGLAYDDNVYEIALKNGQSFTSDAVLVGIGAVANDEIAVQCGLNCDNGILVDDRSCTNDPFIYAIGDVTRRHLEPFYRGRYRLESVPNALEQAKQACCAILEKPAPAVELPWFWSDQFDLKIQIVGIYTPNLTTIERKAPMTGGISYLHLDETHRLRCAECINAPADFMASKKIIAKSEPIDPLSLADPSFSLKALM